nr:substrate-binding domain-containing protein [Lacticaseibacillus thailandensis]
MAAGGTEPLVAVGEFTTESGYATMRQLVQTTPRAQLPSAFFVANDTMAIGAIKALQEAGLRVPQDVTIVGFDDLAIGRYLTPALSTVHVATQELGQVGVQQLHALITGQVRTPTRTTLASTLVERQS